MTNVSPDFGEPDRFRVSPQPLLAEGLTQRLCQLVGTGCSPAFAIDAFETCDHVGSLHPARQQTYSLGIPVTSAFEADAFDDISLQFDFDGFRTGTLCLISEFLCHFERIRVQIYE